MSYSHRFIFVWVSLLLIAVVFLLSGSKPAAGQTSNNTLYIESFTDPFTPTFHPAFNHSFAQATAWDVTGWVEPIPHSPPYSLRLYGDNVNTITFNLPSPNSIVTDAFLLASDNSPYGPPAEVVFEGTGDRKTMLVQAGSSTLQTFGAQQSETGDNGRLIGPIVAIQLRHDGHYDDISIRVESPPTTADLALNMTGPTQEVQAGDSVTYQLDISNNGPDNANNTRLENQLPFGVDFDPALSDPRCTAATSTISCDLGTVNANSQQTIQIAGTVTADVCRTVENAALVFSLLQDPVIINNAAVSTTTSNNPPCANISVNQAPNFVPNTNNTPFNYNLTVANAGPDASAAAVEFTLPEGVTFEEAAGDAELNCTGSGRAVNCNVATLQAGQAVNMSIVVNGRGLSRTGRAAEALSVAQATATATIPDPVPADNLSISRFSYGVGYSFDILAEIGVDRLERYTMPLALDINEAGQVAFTLAVDNPLASAAGRFGVFYADETGLTRIANENMIPVAYDGRSPDLSYPYIPKLTDTGEVLFATETANSGQIFSGNGTENTLIMSDTAEDGNLRRFGHVEQNSSGLLAASFRETAGAQRYGIVTQTNNGAPAVVYSGDETNIQIDSLALNEQGGMAFMKRTIGFAVDKELLLWPANTAAPFVFDRFDALRYTSPQGSRLGFNNQGQVALNIKQQIEGNLYWSDGLYTGQAAWQPFFVGAGLGIQTTTYGRPALNDHGRQAYYCTFPQCLPGIYTGPNQSAQLVATIGTPIENTTIAQIKLINQVVLNNSGQIAFAAQLSDNRIVIVRANPIVDTDRDGVTDYEESGVTVYGDGSGDNLGDNQQPHVVSAASGIGGGYVTFSTTPQGRFQNFSVITDPPASPPAETAFPLGLFDFDIVELAEGSTAEVSISGSLLGQWWSYGPTPDNLQPHWYLFTYDGTTGVECINGQIILHLVDGERGDHDLTTNGVVQTAGGASQPAHTVYLPLATR